MKFDDANPVGHCLHFRTNLFAGYRRRKALLCLVVQLVALSGLVCLWSGAALKSGKEDTADADAANTLQRQ